MEDEANALEMAWELDNIKAAEMKVYFIFFVG